MESPDPSLARAAADEPPTGATAAGTPPARSAWGRWVRRLADILLIAGGLVLAYPFWSAGYAQIQQSRLDTAYRERSTAFVAAVGASPDTGVRDVSQTELVRRLAVLYGRSLKTGDPVGRLRIPRLGLDRLVQQGAPGRAGLDPDGDRALLRSGPVHYGMTPLPGAGEPFAVAGHRTTYGAPFYKLDRLKRGDPIYVETPYAKLRYKVERTTVVRPDDIGVLYDRGYGLVLTTCTPPYSASHRLIVWSSLVRAVPRRKAVSAAD